MARTPSFNPETFFAEHPEQNPVPARAECPAHGPLVDKAQLFVHAPGAPVGLGRNRRYPAAIQSVEGIAEHFPQHAPAKPAWHARGGHVNVMRPIRQRRIVRVEHAADDLARPREADGLVSNAIGRMGHVADVAANPRGHPFLLPGDDRGQRMPPWTPITSVEYHWTESADE